MKRRWALVALLAYGLVAGGLTLGPLPEHLFDTVVHAVRVIGDLPYLPTAPIVERTANVLLFLPIGLLLCASIPRGRELSVWLVCLLGSAGIEAAQSLLPDRTTSWVDVATNGVGAGLGCLLHRRLRPRGTAQVQSWPPGDQPAHRPSGR